MNATDLIGTVGVGLILTAYFCSTFKYIGGNSRLYFGLNALGAALACYASYLILYWPFVVLEGTWMIVSIVALAKVKTQQVDSKKKEPGAGKLTDNQTGHFS